VRLCLIYLRPCQHDDGYMDGRSQIKVHTDERTQVHIAQSSLAVTHPSTNRASVTESLSYGRHSEPLCKSESIVRIQSVQCSQVVKIKIDQRIHYKILSITYKTLQSRKPIRCASPPICTIFSISNRTLAPVRLPLSLLNARQFPLDSK